VAAQMDRAAKIDAIKKLHVFGFDFDIFCPVGGIIDDMIEEFDVVFSQVTLICDTCGVNPLESTLATRVLERVNNYKID